MQEDKLLPHVENLVPGYVTLLLLAAEVPGKLPVQQHDLAKLLGEPVIAGLILTATAYLIGVVVFMASRLLVDTASGWTFRLILLRTFERSEFPAMPVKGWKEWQQWRSEVNERYRVTVRAALHQRKLFARREVIKRRERGRLVRTALLPACYVAYRSPWGGWGWGLLLALAVVFLYAYAEVTVYKEAKLVT